MGVGFLFINSIRCLHTLRDVNQFLYAWQGRRPWPMYKSIVPWAWPMMCPLEEKFSPLFSWKWSVLWLASKSEHMGKIWMSLYTRMTSTNRITLSSHMEMSLLSTALRSVAPISGWFFTGSGHKCHYQSMKTLNETSICIFPQDKEREPIILGFPHFLEK